MMRNGRSVEPRHDGGNALGLHGLARAWRPEQGQVMAARRAHLGRSPGHRLAEQLGEVGRQRGVRAGRLTLRDILAALELGCGRVAARATSVCARADASLASA